VAQAFEQWSDVHLNQWHYVLGYMLTLVSHNWPIMLAAALSVWFGYQAYVRPTRLNVSWLLTALLLGLLYEYAKHIAAELHTAIDFLFGLEIAHWNRPLHVLVGPAMHTVLTLGWLGLLVQSLRLSIAAWHGQATTATPPAAHDLRPARSLTILDDEAEANAAPLARPRSNER